MALDKPKGHWVTAPPSHAELPREAQEPSYLRKVQIVYAALRCLASFLCCVQAGL